MGAGEAKMTSALPAHPSNKSLRQKSWLLRMAITIPHIGSWGLPDFGFTELLTKNRTAQGGSDIIPNQQTATKINDYLPPPKIAGPVNTPVTQKQSGAVPQNQPTNTVQNVPTGEPSGPSLDQQISDMYNPALAGLNQYTDWAKSANAAELEQAGTAKTQAESALQELISGGLVKFENQSGDLALQQRKAESASQRDYRNALQQAQSRFGQGSSTGQDLSEIILSEFLRSGGDIRESYANGFKVIQQAKHAFDADVQLKADKIETEHKASIDNINNDFKQRMAEISMRKGEIEMAKSAARIDAMQSAVAMAQQLEANKQTRLAELQNLKAEYELNISNSTNYLDNLISNVTAEMKTRELNGTTDLSRSFLSSAAPQQNLTPLFRQTGGANDPYAGLMA